MEKSKLLEQVLDNIKLVTDHYSEAVWIVERKKLEAKVSSEKPMKEVQQLMNWYFEDMVNLQMNVEKLYRGLNRCLKLQEDSLSSSVDTVVLAELNGNYRNKTTETFIRNLRDDPNLTGKRKTVNESYKVKKKQLERMVEKVSIGLDQKKYLIGNYKSFRHISVKKILNCMVLGSFNNTVWHYIKKDSPGDESELGASKYNLDESELQEQARNFVKDIQRNTPKFKNYFNGKQCLNDYIKQNLENIDRIKEGKRSFKARYLSDFVKGFKGIFEIKRGININSLSSIQVTL